MNRFSYSKYSNRRTEVDGIAFASKKEAGRYMELKILQKVGQISDLQVQPIFILQVGFQLNNVKHRAITYIADFQYKEDNKIVVEDVKGIRTEVYKLKLKLFLYKFPQIKFVEIS